MRYGLLIGLAVVSACAAGCTTSIKQGVYAVRGASGRYYEVQRLGGKASLDRFNSVQVEEFDSSPMMGAIPGGVARTVCSAITIRLAELESFQKVGRTQGPEPALLIRGKFVDYDPGGTPLRAVGFGVDPFLTAQIELVDRRAGKVIGVAMVTGTVKSAIRTGLSELAGGLGKAVKGLLEAHLTEPDER